MQEMLEQGRQVSLYQQQYVLDVLKEFNDTHRLVLDSELALQSRALNEDQFLRFVGAGQPSLLHLAKYIQSNYHSLLDDEVQWIHREHGKETSKRDELLVACAKKMKSLDLEGLINRFLQPISNPSTLRIRPMA